MTDSNATELREKLDALGIEHFDFDKGGRTQTMWESPDSNRHFNYETFNNEAKTSKLTISWFPTPEQAIAATLGAGECEIDDEPDGWYKCDDCGCVVGYWLLNDDSWTIYMDDYQIPFNNCPNCGKAVKR